MASADLLNDVRSGSVAALSRLCRLLDADVVDAALLDALLTARPTHWTVGVTGSPGVGKSTLVSRLVGLCRARGQRVAVVAVDPTSPFSGGAILGDRIRMQEHTEDPEVFIRSLATRGAHGGLADGSWELTLACGLWGADVVFVETVGAGQAEFDVMEQSDTVVVVTAPGLGDEVQAAKAGILEIADVLVVNKADRPEAARALADLRGMLALAGVRAQVAPVRGHTAAAPGEAAQPAGQTWSVHLLSTAAEDGTGISELLSRLDDHRRWLASETGQGRSQARARTRIRKRLGRELLRSFEQRSGELLNSLSGEVALGQRSLSDALEQIQAWLRRGPGS